MPSPTLTGPTLNRDRLSCKLSVCIDSSLFWDDTNKRWKSGRFSASVLSFDWTGTEQAGEYAEVTIRPPNFNPACHPQAVFNPEVDDTLGTLATAYKNVTAINYGFPGPSARLEADGTITLVEVENALPVGTLSEIVPTISYDVEFTEYSPYTTLSGATSKSATLELLSDNEAVWAAINRDKLASDKYGVIGVQLRSLDTDFAPGFPTGASPISLFVANAAQQGGLAGELLRWPLPPSADRSKTLDKAFTMFFGVNAGLIDANGTPFVDPNNSKTVYNLLNVGLQKGAMSEDWGKAVLAYDVVENLLA